MTDGEAEIDFACDIDLTLVRENLKLTPAQRLEKFVKFMRFIGELRQAGENARQSEANTSAK